MIRTEERPTAAGRARGPQDPAAGGEFVLTFHCPDSLGIVQSVADFLLRQECYIVDLKQFGDRTAGHFFMRVHFASTSDATGDTAGDTAAVEQPAVEQLRDSFAPLAGQWSMDWRLERHDRKQRILVMVSKYDHCLNDLLVRARNGELPVEIAAVVSNHPDLEGLAAWHGLPFHHIPVTPETKAEAEARLLGLVDDYEVELVVLARYMQVLSDSATARLAGRAINIHHSFLPSFKGAKPYHQAHERGVKTVGATAHYVNSELDEGPIIAQQVIEVDHTYTPADLVSVGKDAECKALTNAVRWHAEGRIILSGNRTVILR
ncbi:formyltetrahydrofolate deformylase [Arthrobacter sp. FW305-BF8]|uniref:formyltetrahydrofolate deformylase n=1 Tax=Arthrobacter sp. FW305-BF8 TaxID=2879617 RepID=UPI001F02734D|nr:formyltetrahydrofolate deformylase [Arthrobacter sp. FW305-BF8]UKA56372.1 formyltetrahydrofolate deformylase [Arthrobacter sp. FW305-BF8]